MFLYTSITKSFQGFFKGETYGVDKVTGKQHFHFPSENVQV